MFDIDVPYDRTKLHISLPEECVAGVLEGHQSEFKAEGTQEQLIEQALDNPYSSPTLEELCRNKRDIVIISSDHTRPVPSKVTMPILLRRIHAAAPQAHVRILVATGMHRPSTHEELVDKYGADIVANEEIVMHVATDDEAMAHIGTLPSGGSCIINRIAAQADLLLAEGFIEPHFFAGFSGSRKSVLPGIASYKTIMYNHNGQFIHDSHSRAGVLDGNQVHKDMMAAAQMAGLNSSSTWCSTATMRLSARLQAISTTRTRPGATLSRSSPASRPSPATSPSPPTADTPLTRTSTRPSRV